jgi:hypothetical protein
MAETTSADYRYWTSNAQVFRARDPNLLDRWLYRAGKWGSAAGTHALSQEEQNRLREITPAEAQRRIDSPEPICAMHFGGRGEEWQQARDAIRDILYLYWDLAYNYGGFPGDHDTGTFKPWDFLDCTVEEGYGGADAEQLLHQGAAVALLSWLMDWWDQGWPAGDPATYRAALEAGRFEHLPAARAAVVAGLDGPDSMDPFLAVVFEDYVRTFLETLSRPPESNLFRPLG